LKKSFDKLDLGVQREDLDREMKESGQKICEI
jgi:hypothetical protein